MVALAETKDFDFAVGLVTSIVAITFAVILLPPVTLIWRLASSTVNKLGGIISPTL